MSALEEMRAAARRVVEDEPMRYIRPTRAFACAAIYAAAMLMPWSRAWALANLVLLEARVERYQRLSL